MPADVERSIEERLRAELAEVAESVTVDGQSDTWPGEAASAPRRLRGPRAVVTAGIAVLVAVGISVAVIAGVNARRVYLLRQRRRRDRITRS
jgi:hypothetical protein